MPPPSPRLRPPLPGPARQVPPAGAIIRPVDQEEYVRAARAIRDANSPSSVIGVRSSLFNAFPIGGGRRILEAVAELIRRTETELRGLDPPAEDRRDLEVHFLRPWSELARYVEGLLGAPGARWISANGAIKLLEGGPPERREDIEFCIAYGLDDDPDQSEGPAGGPPAHRGNGKA